MRVVIVGAGQVGSSIAESLQSDHEVIIIDTDAERVDRLLYTQDILAIEGDGSSLSTLREAEVGSADVVIASTDDDKTNIITCATAKVVSDAFTIARTKRATYHETWQQAGSVFGVDFMVSTNLLTAETVVRVIGIPAAKNVDTFAEGRALMAEFSIPTESPLAEKTVAEIGQFSELTVTAILREGQVIIPDGETTFAVDDDLVVVGSPESMRTFASDLTPDHNKSTHDIAVIGGSEIGVQVSHLLEDRGRHPRLVERNEKRARELAEELSHTTVLSSDATDQGFLAREHIGDADVIVTALDSDEKTLLACLLASSLGVDRTIAIVQTADYADLFEAVGVSAAINPRDVTSEEIIRFTHKTSAENIALIDHNRAELLEIKIGSDSALANREIKESMADLPAHAVIGMIIRDDDCIVPRGDTTVKAGDHTLIFVETDDVDEVASSI